MDRGAIRWGFLILLVLIVAGGAGGFWFWREYNREYTLRYRPKQGQTYRYFTQLDLTVQGQQVKMTATQRYKVVRVEPNGNVVLQMVVESADVEAMGRRMAVPGGKPTNLVLSSRGKLLRASSGQAQSLNQFGDQIEYPQNPVKLGTEWSALSTKGGIRYRIQCRVVGRETVRGYETLKLAFTINDITNPSQEVVSAEGQIWVDLATGVTVKVELDFRKLRNPMFGPNPIDVQGKFVMRLQ